MRIFLRGVFCAAFTILISSTSHAESLYLNVPVGGYGSLTAPSTASVEEEMKDIPGGADTVPAEEFKDGYALSLRDMLATSPGVFAQPRYGEESRLSIRGSGLSRGFHLRGITLFQDGIPLSFADGSGDFQEIDPLILQHVEVYRGGQGLRFGAATLGGAINFVTPSAANLNYNGLLRVEGGSYKTLRLHGEAAKVTPYADGFAAVTRSLTQGYRDQSESNTQRFSGNIGVPLGRDAETRFYMGWNDIQQEVPGTLSREDALHDPEKAPAINILNDYSRDIHSLRLANRTAFITDDGWKMEFGGYVNDKSLYHPIFEVIDQDSVDVGGFARLDGEYDFFSADNEFMLGVNTSRGVNNADRFQNIRGNRGNLTSDARQVAKNIEIYGENRLAFAPDWNLITGLQASFAKRDFEDHRNAANDDGKIYRSLNPKLGVLWEIAPETEIFASITKSSEPPTFSELVQFPVTGFVPLDLQTAWTAEVGTRGRHGAFSWDATLYHARVQDELLQFTTGPDIPAATFNADKTVHRGLELGAGWQATKSLSFQGIYNLNDFRFDGDDQFGDNRIAGAPVHQLRLIGRLEHEGKYIEPNIEYVPDAPYVDFANTFKADSYTVLNLKAGWEINDNLSLFFDARNLTDKRHITSFSTVTDARTATNLNVFYPGEGRSVFGGLQMKF